MKRITNPLGLGALAALALALSLTGARAADGDASAGAVVRCPVAAASRTTLSLADVDILSGADASWTVVNGTHTFPYGQPCVKLDITILHPAGSALANAEDFFFNYTLSLA